MAAVVRCLAVAAALLLSLITAALWPTAPAAALRANHTVAGILERLEQDQLGVRATLNELTGGDAGAHRRQYTLITRYAASGEPIDRSEQYVYERLRGDGLDVVAYRSFSGAVEGRNVIGQITGKRWPGEIVIVCAHLDSIARPDPMLALGTDDNGSSVAALLQLARVLGQCRCDRAVRFVFFGGEEGAIGSTA